jgi:hypothetical protein
MNGHEKLILEFEKEIADLNEIDRGKKVLQAILDLKKSGITGLDLIYLPKALHLITMMCKGYPDTIERLIKQKINGN